MKYMRLDQRGSIMAEYVWIDGTNGVRCKTKVSTRSIRQLQPRPLVHFHSSLPFRFYGTSSPFPSCAAFPTQHWPLYLFEERPVRSLPIATLPACRDKPPKPLSHLQPGYDRNL